MRKTSLKLRQVIKRNPLRRTNIMLLKKSIDGELVERRCCKICDHDYSLSTSTSNLKDHLKSHRLFLEPEVKDTFTAEQIYQIDKALVLFCILCFVPFSIVGSAYFIKFVYLLNPKSNYKLPCRQTLTKILRDIYKEYKQFMVNVLSNANFLHATTDTWTSCQNYTYLGKYCFYDIYKLKIFTIVK